MTDIVSFLKKFEKLWAETKIIIDNNHTTKCIQNHFQNHQLPISNFRYESLKNKYGIYIFYIKPSKVYTYESLCEDWIQFNYDKYPKVIKRRFNHYIPIDKERWYPFYIGKSENLGKRLNEHINHNDKISTYSLKLNGRKKFNPNNIKYSYWNLPDEVKSCPKEIKQFLLTQLEHQLRQELKPWVGRQ